MIVVTGNNGDLPLATQRRVESIASGDRPSPSLDRIYQLGLWLAIFSAIFLRLPPNIRPETVVRWHRRGFAAYWRWKSRSAGGCGACLYVATLPATDWVLIGSVNPTSPAVRRVAPPGCAQQPQDRVLQNRQPRRCQVAIGIHSRSRSRQLLRFDWAQATRAPSRSLPWSCSPCLAASIMCVARIARADSA